MLEKMAFFNFLAAACLVNWALADETCLESEACSESSNFLQIAWETENRTLPSQLALGMLLQHNRASVLASSAAEAESDKAYTIGAFVVIVIGLLVMTFQSNGLNTGAAEKLLAKTHVTVPDTAPGTWRNVLLLMISASFFMNYACRYILSVALSAMSAEFGYSSTTQGIITCAFYLGHFIGQPAFGIMCQPGWFSPLNCLIFGVTCWSTASMLTPWAAQQSVYMLILVRVGLGLFQGAAYPPIYSIVGEWVPKNQKAIFAASVGFGQCLGAACADCTSAITSKNWHIMFYAFGLMGIAWCIPAWFLMSDTPATHPFVSLDEAHYIQECFKAEGRTSKKDALSYWEIMQERSWIANLVATCCWSWSWFCLLGWMPTFFEDVLGFSSTTAGHLAEYGYLLGAFAGMAWGYLFDEAMKQNFLDVAGARQWATSISMMGSAAVFLMVMSTMYSTGGAVQGSLLAMAVVLLTANKSGTWANMLDIGGSASNGKVVASINSASDIFGVINSIGVGVALDTTSLGWHGIFFSMAALNTVGAVFFVQNMSAQPFGTAEVPKKSVDG